METIVQAGAAADALRINQLYQVLTRSAYWSSGGEVSPGNSTTQVEVDVAAGDGAVGGSETFWSATSVALADPDSNPRVDVVYVRSDGSLAAQTGTPHAYRPNTDENGDPITPAPFNHWQPAPDDGGNVTGLPLACVLVKPTTADSTDLTTEMIQDRRLSTVGLDAFLNADGVNNGASTITVNDADLVFQDETDSTSEYLWRDHSDGWLWLGNSNATPILNADLNMGANHITDVVSIASNTGVLSIDGGVNAQNGDLERGGQSAVTSGDGAEQREIYVQSSQPSTSEPYIRFEP